MKYFAKMAGNKGFSLMPSALILIIVATSACQRSSVQPGETGDAGPEKSTGERIAEADALYQQRKDLSNVRRGIIALRQARTRDPGSYEAAWKLAKFDYYLGSHAKEDAERDTAFRDGIDAGKCAGEHRCGHQLDKNNVYFYDFEVAVFAVLLVLRVAAFRSR